MRKKLLILFTCVLSLYLTVTTSQLQAKEAMGFLTGSSTSLSPGLYTFDLETGSSLSNVSSIPYFLMGGAYAEKNYWMMLSYDESGNLGQIFSVVDPATGKVLKNTNQNYGCTDITYDLSTGDLYGVLYTISGSPVPHQLVRIDRPNGNYTKVAALGDRFMALACDLWGNMYAMNTAGVLHRVDKHSGEAVPVGDTGIKASTEQVQSMEFDRESGLLYWSFLDMDDNSWIAEIDPETGAVVKKHTMENNALLGAIHIPYNEVDLAAPGQVTDFLGSSDGEKVYFSWKAPAVAVNGSALTDNMRLEIRREGKLAATFDDVVPGSAGEWTDISAPQGADVTYAFTCYMNEVRGASLFTTVHVGDDVPASVEEISTSVSGNNVAIEWKAPVNDKNGVPLDPDKLHYRVTRQPDNIVFDNIGTASYTDTSIPVANQYRYTVTPINHIGEGESRDSETVIAGPALQAPWYPAFDKPSELSQFVIVDANDDNNTWKLSDGAMRFSCMYGAGDDWLITMPMHLEKDMQYKLKCNIGTGGWGEDMKITLGSGFTPESQNIKEIFNQTGITSSDETISRILTVDESGDYTVGIYCYTAKWEGMYLDIRSLEIEPVGAVDLAINEPIIGEMLPELELPAVYTVKVYNNGTETQSGFALSLMDDNDKILASAVFDKTIAPGESSDCEITWIPLSSKVRHLRAMVNKEGDVNALNNVSRPIEVFIPNANEEVAVFGDPDSNPGLFPFSFDDMYSFAESVYTSEELGVDGGMISEISWKFNNPGESLLDKDIQVYMANTSMSEELTDYLREEDMICVYDGKASFPSGENTLTVVLDTPFAYAGGNLAILTKKNKDTATGIRVTWQARNFPDTPRTAISVNSNGVVDPMNVLVSSMLPCIRMKLNTAGAGSLSGTVSCNGEALEDVLVSLDGKMTETKTDASGHYRFGWLPAGSYDISVTPSDYKTLATTYTAEITAYEEQTGDVTLAPRPAGTLYGHVSDGNGSPVTNAAVNLSGWENLKAISDDQGNFSFDKVYSQDNISMTVYALGYKAGFHEFRFDAEPDADPLKIELEAVHNPVPSAWTKSDGDNMTIGWNPVEFSYDIITDTGIPTGVVRIDANDTYMLAKRFDGPLMIDRIMWHSGENSDNDEEGVQAYVYILNENGLPDNLAFFQTGCDNMANTWNELDVYDRSGESLYAPYGCLVAIGSPGKLSVSKDDSGKSGSYIIDEANGTYAQLTDENGHQNLLIRICAYYYDEDADMKEPCVTYNVYRLLSDDKEDISSHTLLREGCASADPVTDTEWMTLPDNYYMYAVEAVYPDGFKAQRHFTDAVARSIVEDISADEIRVLPIDGAIVVKSTSDCRIEIYDVSGIIVSDVEMTAGIKKIDLIPGMYVVKVNGNSYKVNVK